MSESPGDVTRLLRQLSRDNPQAANELAPLIYGELRRLAAAYLRRERPGHSLQATELVNEAFLRLAGASGIEWQSRAHFFGIAARIMREVLVDRARRHASAKRSAGVRITLSPEFAAAGRRLDDVLLVDEVLARLETLDPRQARIVELRFFAGMSVEEIAEVMGISTPTVKREWASARAWLHRELAGGADDAGTLAAS